MSKEIEPQALKGPQPPQWLQTAIIFGGSLLMAFILLFPNQSGLCLMAEHYQQRMAEYVSCSCGISVTCWCTDAEGQSSQEAMHFLRFWYQPCGIVEINQGK